MTDKQPLVIGDTPEQMNIRCANWVDVVVVDGVCYDKDAVANLLAQRDYFKNGMAELQDIIDKLEPERDALVAQVSRMSTFIKLSAAKWENCNDVYPTFWNLLRVAKETPQQHLAEIRAEAGRAGYIQALKDFAPVIEDFSESDFKAADIYAERVKAGQV